MKSSQGDDEGMLVAIDGPAGSGKSSVARMAAERLGVVNLNTGATYRAVALFAIREGVPASDGASLAAIARRVGLDGETVSVDGAEIPEPELRTPEVSAAASKVSSHPEVRAVLVEAQRDAAKKARAEGGAVVEGRDIGTVVLPDADVKVFLSASAEERARRRASQTGREDEIERITAAIKQRDKQDTERSASPLKPAADAVVMDTTTMSLDDVVSSVLEIAAASRKGA
jgi:CMP/dCMP kinase